MELNLAQGLISRGHDADFILLEARIPYPVPPEIRLSQWNPGGCGWPNAAEPKAWRGR